MPFLWFFCIKKALTVLNCIDSDGTPQAVLDIYCISICECGYIGYCKCIHTCVPHISNTKEFYKYPILGLLHQKHLPPSLHSSTIEHSFLDICNPSIYTWIILRITDTHVSIYATRNSRTNIRYSIRVPFLGFCVENASQHLWSTQHSLSNICITSLFIHVGVLHAAFTCVFINALYIFYICNVSRIHTIIWVLIQKASQYGVAATSRLLNITRLFCKRDLWKRRYSAKETYNFKKPADHSHPIALDTAYISAALRNRFWIDITYVRIRMGIESIWCTYMFTREHFKYICIHKSHWYVYHTFRFRYIHIHVFHVHIYSQIHYTYSVSVMY